MLTSAGFGEQHLTADLQQIRTWGLGPKYRTRKALSKGFSMSERLYAELANKLSALSSRQNGNHNFQISNILKVGRCKPFKISGRLSLTFHKKKEWVMLILSCKNVGVLIGGQKMLNSGSLISSSGNTRMKTAKESRVKGEVRMEL